MVEARPRRRAFLAFMALGSGLLALPIAGCAHRPPAATPEKIVALERALCRLSPDVDPAEASRLARTAHERARALAVEYRVVRPAWFHNHLVNSGRRPRGLCYEWAEDLRTALRDLKLSSLEIHWAEARAQTRHEHNGLVVTASGQPFETGILLDAWRHGGRLHWTPVGRDRYPWIEGHYDGTPNARP